MALDHRSLFSQALYEGLGEELAARWYLDRLVALLEKEAA